MDGTGIAEVLTLFSMYDIAILGASIAAVAKITPIINERCKNPKIWGIIMPILISFSGLMILHYMGEHTFGEVLFLTFVFGFSGDYLWHRYKGSRK